MCFFTFPLDVLQLFLLLSLVSTATTCTVNEKHALPRFLSELSQDGGLTVSWSDDVDCCWWEGIICNGDGVITGISLDRKSTRLNSSHPV